MAVNANNWTPKYPEFANRQTATLSSPNVGDDFKVKGADGAFRPLDWMLPPPTSHLHSFAYESTNRTSRYYSRIQALTGRSVLHVRFKPSGRNQTVSHYRYFFTDDGYGQQVLQAMRAAEHPGAEVVNEILIANKVPYERSA